VAIDKRTGIVDQEQTVRLREEERQNRLARGVPFEQFIKEWSALKPPDDLLGFYGKWPDATPNRMIMRL
jgi:acetophenone carboxylase